MSDSERTTALPYPLEERLGESMRILQIKVTPYEGGTVLVHLHAVNVDGRIFGQVSRPLAKNEVSKSLDELIAALEASEIGEATDGQLELISTW